jgi:hypothetical protein
LPGSAQDCDPSTSISCAAEIIGMDNHHTCLLLDIVLLTFFFFWPELASNGHPVISTCNLFSRALLCIPFPQPLQEFIIQEIAPKLRDFHFPQMKWLITLLTFGLSIKEKENLSQMREN